ncbi:MAG: hypothetical protein KAV87_51620 [Desulfobacteraceae bacterium]|nr:hypothetical protein [Desulfobacteraceae bacterium]
MISYPPAGGYDYTRSDPDVELESGKLYLADFDVSGAGADYLNMVSMSQIENKIVTGFKAYGYDIKDVVMSAPAPGIVRCTFRPNTPLWLVIVIIAAAISTTALAMSYAFSPIFIGIKKLAELPDKIITSAFNSPWTVIAIIAAIGLFILSNPWKMWRK